MNVKKPTMTVSPDAVVLTAPDGSTKYVKQAVEQSIEHMDQGAVLQVPRGLASGLDIAEWCLRSGHRIVNPFEHCDIHPLLIEKSTARPLAA